jgi:transcriptional regulator with XRE-family HTH domain
MSETFGQYVRSLREGRGLTQRALSQAVGFRSLAHLSDIESGKRNPAKETLPKFAKALGVTLSDLESHDTRGPIEAAKALFARKPEMVGAFLKVIEAAKKMDAEELVSRVTRKPEVPAPVPVLEAPVVAPPVVAKPELSKPEVSKPEPKPVPEKKPSAQATLF